MARSDRRDLYRIPRAARPFIAVALVLLLLLSAWLLYSWYNAEPDLAGEALPGSVVEISAPELAAAYDQDLVGAQTRFDGRILRVTGTVSGVSAGSGGPVIALGGSDPLLTVTAAFDRADTARLTNAQLGQPITVTCQRVSVVVDSPALENCRLPAGAAGGQ